MAIERFWAAQSPSSCKWGVLVPAEERCRVPMSGIESWSGLVRTSAPIKILFRMLMTRHHIPYKSNKSRKSDKIHSHFLKLQRILYRKPQKFPETLLK
jgi:hypothetical protein